MVGSHDWNFIAGQLFYDLVAINGHDDHHDFVATATIDIVVENRNTTGNQILRLCSLPR